MPERILALLESGSLTEMQIAEQLAVSVAELKACMEYLQQMGFIKATVIKPTAGGCSGNCGKCSSTCNTASATSYKIWEIV